MPKNHTGRGPSYPIGFTGPAMPPVEPVETDDTPNDRDDAQRPGQRAKISAWRDYATSQGIDTEGLSKKDIIAALDGR